MADNVEIRGLSVEFDADFSKFKKGMKDAEKDISSTERQLKSLQGSLKLEWDATKFKKAQQQAQQALEASEKKAGLLKSRLAEINEAGITEKSRSEYNWLQEELAKTELHGQKLKEQLESLDDIRLSHLTKDLDKASKGLDNAANKTKALSAAATAAVTGMVALGLSTVKEADDIATLATKYDMSTDAIQRFNYVALQTDTSAEELYKAFVKVRSGVSDLKSGAESASTKALSQLGLSFDQFSGKEDQFYAIIEALSKMEDEVQMVTIANDIFGEEMATNLFPLIYAGTDAINEYKSEFEEMGYLTSGQVKQLAEFDNVLNELKTEFKSTGLELGVAFLPILEDFSTVLKEDVLPMVKELVDWYKGLDENQQKILLSLLLFVAALSPALLGLSKLIDAGSSVVKLLGKLDKAVLTSYGKWVLLGAAIYALFSVLSNWSKMNTTQKIVGLLGALSAAALAAAVAFGVFHSAWSIGLAIAGITAGITTAIAAVQAAGKQIGSKVSFNSKSYGSSLSLPEYSIPQTVQQATSNTTNNNSTYVDNSNVVVTIEKNDYMSEDDIVRAVNKGLKNAKQARK